MNQNDAERAVEAFYEAALRPETWPDALQQIAVAFNASGATAQMVGSDGFLMLNSPSYDGVSDEYINQGWHLNNRRMERGLAMTRAGHQGFATEYQMFTAEELAREPYEQEFAPRFDVDAEAGIVLASHAGSSFVLTTPRSLRTGPYLPREIARMNHVAARIAAASSFALRMKLATAASMMETLCGRGEALALVSPVGRVLCSTAAFERLLETGRLTARDGRVFAQDATEDGELQALIRRAGEWTADAKERLAPIVIGKGSSQPLAVRCMPVAGAARDFLGLARIVLSIEEVRDPRRESAEAALRAAFPLTAAETRLAQRIGRGETLREAASAERITYETARTRLKTIFRKTGTSRQSELILLLDSLRPSPDHPV